MASSSGDAAAAMHSRVYQVHGSSEARNAGYAATPRYDLQRMPQQFEDIVLCVDTDKEVDTEMKAGVQSLTRLDAVRQALLLFVHAKLAIHPKHRFAFLRLAHQATWHQQEFTSDVEVITNSIRTLSSDGVCHRCNLSSALRTVALEAKSCHAQGRILRLVLVYCRSSVVPEMTLPWPENQRPFTFDAMYLHDKPGPNNCPQKVYDGLVDALERVSQHEAFIFESSSGMARVLFKNMCVLLAHPQQRIAQDDFDAPRDLAKAVVPDPVGAGGPSRKDDGDPIYVA